MSLDRGCCLGVLGGIESIIARLLNGMQIYCQLVSPVGLNPDSAVAFLDDKASRFAVNARADKRPVVIVESHFFKVIKNMHWKFPWNPMDEFRSHFDRPLLQQVIPRASPRCRLSTIRTTLDSGTRSLSSPCNPLTALPRVTRSRYATRRPWIFR